MAGAIADSSDSSGGLAPRCQTLQGVQVAEALLPHRPVVATHAFESIGRAVRIGDAAANLIQPGGSSYDFAVLQANLRHHGVHTFLMTAADLQGGDGASSMMVVDRFSEPFADQVLPGEGAYQTLGYLLRLPSSGGHWVSVLAAPLAPPSRLIRDAPEFAAYLCDSLHPAPFGLQTDEVGELLLACAFEAIRGADVDLHSFHPDWCCFLLGLPLYR